MKNTKSLYTLFLANGVSSFAQGITMLSIPWYFTSRGESSLFIAFFAIVTLGSLFWGLYAGALIDGFNRKDIFLGTNFVQGLIVMSVASLGYREGGLPSSLVLIVFGMIFFGYLIHYPNLYAFAQEISDSDNYTRVASWIEVVGQTTAIGAAALAAVLLEGVHGINLDIVGMKFHLPIYIDKWAMHEIFLLDAGAYFLSFIIIMLMPYTPSVVLSIHQDQDIWKSMKEGYDYLKNNLLINVFGLCSYSIFVIVLVELFSLVPLYVRNHLHESAYVLGTSELMYASGSLISAFVISKLFAKMSLPKAIIIMTFMTTFAFYLSALSGMVWLFYVVCFLKGFVNSGSRIFRVSYLFRLVPVDLTGRVNSMFNVYTTIFRMVFILAFAFPFFSQGSNVTYAYAILGTFTLLAGLILIILYPKFLKLTEGVGNTPRAH
ncbi:MAG: permease of the major facilitator superfamily [Chitinophagaceae bacterium]|nr:permease of the major facilitator superfamily [Chitinophagaceae bacterium]